MEEAKRKIKEDQERERKEKDRPLSMPGGQGQDTLLETVSENLVGGHDLNYCINVILRSLKRKTDL